MTNTDNKKESFPLGHKSAYSSKESRTGGRIGAISPIGSVRGHSPYNRE